MILSRLQAFRSIFAYAAVLFGSFGLAAAQSFVQVPIASEAVGIPSLTFNGAANGASCTTNAPFTDTHGDGCPALQTSVNYSYGSVVDGNDNVLYGEYTTNLVHVLYRGGSAMASALLAANPDPDRSGKNLPFTPTPGYVYLIAGGGHTLTGALYCNGTSGTIALDTVGDGCPAQYAILSGPRSVAVDRDGNVFLNNTPSGKTGIRVVYVGGTLGARLISSYNPGVVPQVGFIYNLSAPGDFVTIRDIAVDSQENVYVADNGAATATAGNQVKRLSATGTAWTTFLAGGPAAPAAPNGDGGVYTSATVSGPFNVAVDPYDNIYVDDQGDQRIRVVYNAGTIAPVYLQGANAVAVTPVAGSIYTIVGGGAVKLSGSKASALSIGATSQSIGLDASRNFLFTDSSNILWRVTNDGTAVVIGGSAATTASYTAATVAAAGNSCNGANGGPSMVDAYGDGCPATEVLAYRPIGHITFDSAGNLYQSDYRSTTSATGIIREYSFNNQFGPVAVGTTSTRLLAYTPVVAASIVTPSEALFLNGNTSTTFIDGGGGLCSTTNSVETCTYNVVFTPAGVGGRAGSITLTTAGTVLATSPLGGIGVGPLISLDPAVVSTLGSNLAPSGVALDAAGNVYLADSTSNSVLVSTAGAAPVAYATGFANPQQLALNGAGTLFVADTGNNRVAMVPKGGVPSALSTVTLTAPQGVATDLAGNIYIADTGANRVVEVTAFGNSIIKPFTGLNGPRRLFVDAGNNIFVADTGNSRIVELSSFNLQSTVAISPALTTPLGIAGDAAGNLYVADAGTGNVVIVPVGTSSALVEVTGMSGLSGIAVDTAGNFAVAATGSKGLLQYGRTSITRAFPDTYVGSTSSLPLAVSNTGNAVLTLGSTLNAGSDVTDFVITGASGTTPCVAGSQLAPGATCAATFTFQPQGKGALSDTATLPSNAVNSTTALLTGNGLLKIGATTVTLQTSPSATPPAGTAFTITATVGVAGAGGPITGTVAFTVSPGNTTQTINLNASTETATASFTPPVGNYTITAIYSGDKNYTTSAATTSVNVLPAGTSSVVVTVVSPQAPNVAGQTLTVKAAVTTGNGTAVPSGTVNFTVDGKASGSFPYGAVVQTSFSSLGAGNHVIVATYSGDGSYVPSSGTLNATIVQESPTIALTAVNAIVASGNTITLTATVTGPATPGGNVVFSSGGTTLGTVSLVSTVQGVSVATLAVKNNATTSYTFTAAYGGDVNNMPASATYTPPPDFLPALAAPTLTIPQYGVALGSLTVYSFEGYTGNVSVSCTGLPANSICRATPAPSAIVANGATTIQLQIYTCVDPTQYTASQHSGEPFTHRSMPLLAGLLALGLLPLGAGRRRRKLAGLLACCLCALCGMYSVTGCSSDTRATADHATPVGTYNVTVNVTDGTITHSTALAFAVSPGTAQRP